MTITATVIADSIADGCPRITTMQLRYPRFIHAEFMTHRVFSRNSSSSRAIPIRRVIQDVLDDTAMPIYWGRDKSGMQSGDEVVGVDASKMSWIAARDDAIKRARHLAELGNHKQTVNRLLEPYQHINVLVTATDWDNFFALRDHSDAQPEIAALARAMQVAMFVSDPVRLAHNEWHLPYFDVGKLDVVVQWSDRSVFDMKRISSAKCASVSYKTVDGKEMTVDKAIAIYDKLAGGDPIHASPFEHVARPDPDNGKGCRNFTGWHQWRSDIEDDLHAKTD